MEKRLEISRSNESNPKETEWIFKTVETFSWKGGEAAKWLRNNLAILSEKE